MENSTMDYVYSDLRRKTIEIGELRQIIRAKDEQIAKLTSEIDKYRSIFKRSQTLSSSSSSGVPISNLIGGSKDLLESGRRSRGVGISAEPQSGTETDTVDLVTVHKSLQSQSIIRKAILENEFMRNLHTSQIESIIQCMKPVVYVANSIIINEGEVGFSVFVLESGKLTVSKNERFLREVSRETVFGELAILYNCTRTATVTAVQDCHLWSIDRLSFQTIMMKTAIIRQKEILKFLKSVPNFQSMEEEKLKSIVDSLEELHYEKNEYIIRQGGRGDTFYIIANGQVKVTQSDDNQGSEKVIRFMGRGDWFGEKALINEDVRSANIVVESDEGVRCLVLDRESYLSLIGSSGLKKYYHDESDDPGYRDFETFKNVSISEFERIAILGVGGFGSVDLVKLESDETKSFALKKMKKAHIVRTRQQEHVMNERNILFQTTSQFIVRLYKTFKDSKYLYMIMEVCLGGEMWSLLRDRQKFDEHTTRFYVASVIEALNYLHEKLIVYRDLKPENLLIDSSGYLKLTDFGFAKKLQLGRKTWTFCGTPEYVAPEIILNKGHDFAADFWSLGILVYELLTGMPPFYAKDPMKVYNLILKGVDAVNFEKTSRNAQNLIKKLCRDNPSDRVGYGNEGIKMCQKHIWFESFNWDGLLSKSLEAPIKPIICSPFDHSNFDEYPDEEDDAPEDLTDWDKLF